MAALKAREVGEWFIGWAHATDGADNDLTNMKLQKLLYYAQGWHLAEFGTPLFSDTIEAWEHGPVVRAVYRAMKPAGAEPIVLDAQHDLTKLRPGTVDFLIRIWDTYAGCSAAALRGMTHRETPWRSVYQPNAPSIEISVRSLQEFFANGAPRKSLKRRRSVYDDEGPLLLAGPASNAPRAKRPRRRLTIGA